MEIAYNQDTMSKTIMKVAAVIAMLGLILSSFSFAFRAGAQEVTNSNASFNRDLTVGSTGTDVTELQNFLIAKGFAIQAGATGYFGGQTQAALARYQASVGIHPAAGYFGPITRAEVKNHGKPAPDDQDDDDSDDDEGTDEDTLSVEVEIRNNKAYVETELNGDEDSFTINTTSRSRIISNVAKRLGVSTSEVKKVIEFSAEDEDDDSVSNSAKVNDRDGADNDIAIFKIVAKISAIGNDIYIDQDPTTSFNYEVRDAQGDEVTSATSQSEVLTSTADENDGYYVIREGKQETFTLTVSFDPEAADEGQFFHVQLIEVLYNDEEASPDRDWNASPQSKYRTPSAYIAD
jgi:hypothetical protein